jgi:hypothetical protein
MAVADDKEVRAALSRNDRYLAEFIEALAICPYAKSCRESARLHREVLLTAEADEAAMTGRVVALESELSRDIEVALLLLPRLQLSVSDFVHFVGQVQRRYQKGRTQPIAFFVVAFHPELSMQLQNPDVAVRFMRRSPDPTIQLVRPEAIERVRGERSAETVSRQIAEAGLRAVVERGPDKLAALLASISASCR